MIKLFISTALCVLSVININAQERYFSQFYGAPISLDPSLTGNFDGNYRVNLAYRDQWGQGLQNPFSVFSGSADLNFYLGKKYSKRTDIASAGIYFASDKAGILQYGNSEMGLSGAFHKYLYPGTYISGGLYMSFVQRNLNFSNVTFEDMFDGEGGYTANTTESLPPNNFSYFDQGIGVSLASYPDKSNGYNIGVSIAHFTRPEISFYKQDEIAGAFVESFSLPIKYTLHGGARLIINDFFQIMPRGMYVRQGIFDMATLGLTTRVDLPGLSALHLGVFGRGAGANNNYYFDSFGLLTGIEIKNWLVGASYDVGIPNIVKYSRNQSTFEITISYFGRYENDEIRCPTF